MTWRTVSGAVLPGLIAACHASPPVAAPVETGFAMVAPGIISTELPEFALTISGDGKEMYFTRISADRSKWLIMMSRRSAGQWSTPVVASFSGNWRDLDPFITPDGKRLYFTSNRPRTSSNVTSFSTWYVDRAGSGWGEPIDPGPPLNSDSSDAFVSVSRAGDLYFSSTRQGEQAVYVSRLSGGHWAVPVRVLLYPPADGAGNPMISPDGRVLLVTQRNRDGDTDIMYGCFREGRGSELPERDGNWTDLRALPAPVNSPKLDFAPAIDAAGTTLYFTSERPGIVPAPPDSVRPPGDIYRIPLRDAGIDCS